MYPLSIAENRQYGDIFVDNVIDPHSVLFWHYCGFAYLTGEASDTVLKEIRKRLPEVKYVNISNYGFNVDIVRNADVVWVQTNCISHTQYARILKAVRTYGIQLRYFSCASARKCAEQIVEEDQS